MFKNILTFVAVLCFATTAMAGSGTSTFNFGENADGPLLVTQPTALGASGHCMNLTQDVDGNIASAACDSVLVNEIVWPHNAQVNFIKVTAKAAPDAGDYCEFNIEVAGTPVGLANTAATQLVDTVQTLAVNVDLADGALVGIMVEDGEGCFDGTAPTYIVELWGVWVPAAAF
jgi:hypothetical protein